MKTNTNKAEVSGNALAAAGVAQSPETVNELIARIRSKDDKVRGPAWQGAALAGASAVKPLAEVMMDPDFEIARAAKRGLSRIVRHAGRPGAKREAKAVAAELVQLLQSPHALVRREAVWMLSEIGEDGVIAPMAVLLADPEAREDARCALMRFAGRQATSAFRSAFLSAPEDFKYALAESLRERGVKVDGYPSPKVVPSRKTTVGEPPNQ